MLSLSKETEIFLKDEDCMAKSSSFMIIRQPKVTFVDVKYNSFYDGTNLLTIIIPVSLSWVRSRWNF